MRKLVILSVAALLMGGLLSPSLLHADDLAATVPPTISITDVTDQEQINRITGQFQKGLEGMGINGKILTCDQFTQLKQTYGNHSRPGYSYGVSCMIDTGKVKYRLLMCDDTMIGKFTMKNSNSTTLKEIGRFIQDNCSPGG